MGRQWLVEPEFIGMGFKHDHGLANMLGLLVHMGGLQCQQFDTSTSGLCLLWDLSMAMPNGRA